jgi:hypothetical protein
MINTSEKMKRFLNRKILLGLLALFLGVCIIFVCSIVPLAIDPSRWGTTGFISDEIILVALTIMGEVCMIMIAQPYNAGDANSKIAKERALFNSSLINIVKDRFAEFEQWCHQVLEPNDLLDKEHKLLNSVGITNYEYLELDRNTLKELCSHAVEYDKSKHFRQLNKQQYRTIIDILDGKCKIDFVYPLTYLKLDKIDLDKNTSEKMSNQQKKKTLMLVWSVATKSLIVVATGLIFGALMPTGATQTTGETLMKLFVRLFDFASAGFVGFFVGCQINDMDAEYIHEKVLTHIRFNNDKNFKPLNEEELAHKEWKEYQIKEVKKGNAELMNNLDKIEMKGDTK